MNSKPKEIDWLSKFDGTLAMNTFKHLKPLNMLRHPTSSQLLPLDAPIREDSLRIVAISDTHGWSLKALKLPKGDILVHAGDFSRTGTDQQVAEFKNDLDFFAPMFKKVVLIAGNHDFLLEYSHDSRSIFSNYIYLQDESVKLCGVNFYGSPWTPQFYDWAFMKNRGEELDNIWRLIPDNTDILVTHGPPLGILDLCHSGDRSGCLSLLYHALERVKPRYHIFGHIHERHGTVSYGSTTFINASSCTLTYRPINPPIVFDYPIPKDHVKAELLQSLEDG